MKKYKLDESRDPVTFLLQAGKDVVRSTMSVKGAKKIIASGKVEKSSPYKDYPINVSDYWYFPGVPADEKDKEPAE